jgi:hypothetical protein
MTVGLPQVHKIGDRRLIAIAKGNEEVLAAAKESAAAWEEKYGKPVEIIELTPISFRATMRSDGSDLETPPEGWEVNQDVIAKKKVQSEFDRLTQARDAIANTRKELARMEGHRLTMAENEDYELMKGSLESVIDLYFGTKSIDAAIKESDSKVKEAIGEFTKWKGTSAYLAWQQNYTEDGFLKIAQKDEESTK